MIETLPIYISLLFLVTVLLTGYLFLKCFPSIKFPLIIISCWVVIQSIVSFTGFYLPDNSMPPHFLLLVLPPFITAILFISLKKGRQFIAKLNLKYLTLLHVIRIPVEIVLFLLFTHKQVPELMTFEGRNFDIISGITAPVVFLVAFNGKYANRRGLLFWNFICLGLLINIVVHAILSAPFPFQQFAFVQPNVGVFYFPFSLLPGFIVPVVLFAHLVSISRLLKTK